MFAKQSNVLLLTATITPKQGVPNLVRFDPKVRLKDYEAALDFYLSLVDNGVDAIVFAENSNSDVSSLRDLAARRGLGRNVEFLVFDGLDYPPSYDRGYGEFKLLDYAMEKSQFIASGQAAGHMHVWKATGRYIVNNLAQIIARRPQEFDLYCNCRNWPRRLTDMYLMAWTTRGYEACLRNIYPKLKTHVPEVPDGVVPEELLRPLLDRAPPHVKVVPRFNLTPRLSGIRGGDNKGYSTDNLWKFYVRDASRMLLPWAWI